MHWFIFEEGQCCRGIGAAKVTFEYHDCKFRFVSTQYENKRLMSVCFPCLGRPVFMSVHPDGTVNAFFFFFVRSQMSESVSSADQTHFILLAYQHCPEKQIGNEPVT